MSEIRTALAAIQWERAKGELRAMVALHGSYPSGLEENYNKWQKVKDKVEEFINFIENEGLHE